MVITEIRDKLSNDLIDYKEAFELIKKFPKSWHTKEWKEKRDKIIKSHCEQCGSIDGVMVAQHLAHPPEFKTIRNHLFNSLLTESLKSFDLEPKITKEEVLQFYDKTTSLNEACPSCKSMLIRKRKTKKPLYYCDNCKNAFDEATLTRYNRVFGIIVPNEEQILNYLYEEKKKKNLSKFKRELYAKQEKQIGKKSLLIAIDLHLKYMEFENVVTFCKSCAFRMDQQTKLLCWTCKTNYFNYILYECCYKCFEKNEINKNPIKKKIFDIISEDESSFL